MAPGPESGDPLSEGRKGARCACDPEVSTPWEPTAGEHWLKLLSTAGAGRRYWHSNSSMSTADSFETRFENIDHLLRDPKSEVNSDCLLDGLDALVYDLDFPALRKRKLLTNF